jgi:hypothetical protein
MIRWNRGPAGDGLPDVMPDPGIPEQEAGAVFADRNMRR